MEWYLILMIVWSLCYIVWKIYLYSTSIEITYNKPSTGKMCDFIRWKNRYSASYEIYHEDFPYPIRGEGKTLFEYLVEGVIWLLENKYIKKEPKTSSE